MDIIHEATISHIYILNFQLYTVSLFKMNKAFSTGTVAQTNKLPD